jgi:hypothetical protein
VADAKPRKKREGTGEGDVDLATALGNPWRFRIVSAATIGPVSPSQFVRDHGGDISNISRHFRNLTRWGYLTKVETVTGGVHRGATKSIYRATRRAHLDMPASRGLPQNLREGISNAVLGAFLDQVRAATESGTLDADVERNLSWDLTELDLQGFRELSSLLDDVLARLPTLRAESSRRMAESGEEPIPTTVGLFSFRSPSGASSSSGA